MDDDLDAAVFLAAFGGGVGGDGLLGAEAGGGGGFEEIVGEEPVADGLGAFFGEGLVVGSGSDGVGMSFNRNGMGASLSDLGAHFAEGGFGLGGKGGLVEGEEGVGTDREAVLAGGVDFLDFAGLLPRAFGLLDFAGFLPDVAGFLDGSLGGEGGGEREEETPEAQEESSGNSYRRLGLNGVDEVAFGFPCFAL